jgi:hypothetical protein
VTGGVCALGLLTWFFVPESVRWQAQNGQIKEARITLLKIAEVNGKPMNDAKREEIDQGQIQKNGFNKKRDQLRQGVELGGEDAELTPSLEWVCFRQNIGFARAEIIGHQKLILA